MYCFLSPTRLTIKATRSNVSLCSLLNTSATYVRCFHLCAYPSPLSMSRGSDLTSLLRTPSTMFVVHLFFFLSFLLFFSLTPWYLSQAHVSPIYPSRVVRAHILWRERGGIFTWKRTGIVFFPPDGCYVDTILSRHESLASCLINQQAWLIAYLLFRR